MKIEFETEFELNQKVFFVKLNLLTCPKCGGSGVILVDKEKELYKKCECGGKEIREFEIVKDEIVEICYDGTKTSWGEEAHCVRYTLKKHWQVYNNKSIFATLEEAEARVKELQAND